ncbi:uncharacterized protein LOC135160303 [Diachasmimorpha longicaudata]|uniref:uncharacterized protein LOC135160303 n=1 Tax=Diachasmimorpha longicaudata TaxID=58733 RepID=UPI0030B87771
MAGHWAPVLVKIPVSQSSKSAALFTLVSRFIVSSSLFLWGEHHLRDTRKKGHMKMPFPSLILVLVGLTCAKPTTYDQRQTGDLNVQIHLKDLRVVALVDTEMLEDYTDYNYSYDYSDFTIKPKPSPSSGSTTTVSAWHVWPTNAPNSTSKPNGTEQSSSSTTVSSEDSSSTPTSSLDDISSTPSSSNDNSTPAPSSANSPTTASSSDDNPPVVLSSHIESTASPVLTITKGPSDNVSGGQELSGGKSRSPGRCQTGYHPDAKGRCKKGSRRRLSLLPLMRKMLSKSPDPSSA